MKEEEYVERKRKINKIFIWVAISAVFIWALSGYAIHYISFGDNETRGTLGDMFGAINALFSGLALGGVIYTILLQRLELELQRDEIRYSSEQLKGQKEILDRQNFEDKFFKILESFKNSIDEIDYSFYGLELKGNQALEKIVHIDVVSPSQMLMVNDVVLRFERVYEFKYVFFNKYFKELEFIMNFVDSSPSLQDLQKEFYIEYLKVSINESCRAMLAFYGISKYGANLKDIIEKYKMLSGLRFYLISTNGAHEETWNLPKDLCKHYPHLKTSFGKN